MMTTSRVFGISNNNPTPPQPSGPSVEALNKQIELEQEKTRLLNEAINKFLKKEITKTELETIQQTLK